MVRTRSQLENLSKEELIEELIIVDDITSKISDLTNRFDDFLRRFEVVSSDLAIIRNCNRLLTERVVQRKGMQLLMLSIIGENRLR